MVPMRSDASITTAQSTQRLGRWVAFWLRWIALVLAAAERLGPLPAPARALAHGWLDRIERSLMSIVIVRAAARMRKPNRQGRPRLRRGRGHVRRAIAGLVLRRALRSRDWRERIAALSRDVESLVAQVLRRLPCGPTRLCAIAARPEARPHALAMQACMAAFADSS